MRRLHIHAAVAELTPSVEFYTNLFGRRPCVLKTDYAKWILGEPRVNFAITSRGFATGVDHLGIEVDNADELQEVYARFDVTAAPRLNIGQTSCCYASLEKSWVRDPQGVLWEAFLTSRQSEHYGQDPEVLARFRQGDVGAAQK